ncbi:MAG TPA: methyltransferase domain-containing protein [Steroidobacteraceae bacterium]|jgi:ubiquinone/menaquinone biosynthesis C-methylase UbiE|nr:methyltransferase domain-containing protein [Steroidobacteraceae bacterium]
MRTHEQTVQSQFDPRAQAYLTSAVHAAGPDLERAKTLVSRAVPSVAQALDIGCGAGHLSFALAPHVARMVAFDASPSMLAAVSKAASAKGLSQIETRQGNAESLPFADRAFPLVCTRYSAHHWTRLEAAVREADRVLAPGGHALVIDTLGHHDPLVDTFLQAIELLRDPSHVRNRSRAEWRALLQAAGLVELECAEWPTRLEFASWGERMRTPADRIAVIRSLQEGAPREVREALAIEPDGSFTIRTGLFWLCKPA